MAKPKSNHLRPDHKVGSTSTNIPYKWDLLRTADELLRKAKVDPRTTETQAEWRNREMAERRVLASRQRRPAAKRQRAADDRTRFAAEMEMYKAMQMEKK
jgi:hypothetical protein